MKAAMGFGAGGESELLGATRGEADLKRIVHVHAYPARRACEARGVLPLHCMCVRACLCVRLRVWVGGSPCMRVGR